MKILAVVITYNRKEALKENINSLLNSETPCDILVVDNASTDGTSEVVKQYPIIYRRLEKNLGPAGGGEFGQKFALNNNYDFVWMIDDDAIVAKDALTKLLYYYNLLKERYQKIFLSSVTYGDLAFTRPFYNFLKYNTTTGTTRKISESVYLEEYFEYDIAPMNGLFLSRDVLQSVGFINGRFFGWYDDTEFVLRCRRSGFRGFAIPSSKIYHPIESRKQVKIFGKTFTLLSGRPYRMYLGTRNNIIVQREFLKPLNFYLLFLPIFISKRLLSILLFYDDKKEFLKNFFRGIIDGLKGNLEVKNV